MTIELGFIVEMLIRILGMKTKINDLFRTETKRKYWFINSLMHLFWQ